MGATSQLSRSKKAVAAAKAGPGNSVAPFPFAVFGRDELDTKAKADSAAAPDLSIFSAYDRREAAPSDAPRVALVRLLADEHRRSELARDALAPGLDDRAPEAAPPVYSTPAAVSPPNTDREAPAPGVGANPFGIDSAPTGPAPAPGLRLVARDDLAALDNLFAPDVGSNPTSAPEVAPLLPIPGLSTPRVAVAPPKPAPAVSPRPLVPVADGEAAAPFARVSPSVQDSTNLAPLVIPSAYVRPAAPLPLPSLSIPTPAPAARTATSPSVLSWGRIGIVAAALLAMVAGANFVLRRGWFLPPTLGPQASADATAPVDGGKFGGPMPADPTMALQPPRIVAPAAKPPAAERPAPSPAFSQLVGGLKVSGVLQGTPVVALVNGRKIRAGELLSIDSDIRLVDADFAERRLIFEDGTTARAFVRY
jgi:hypothetical protein